MSSKRQDKLLHLTGGVFGPRPEEKRFPEISNTSGCQCCIYESWFAFNETQMTGPTASQREHNWSALDLAYAGLSKNSLCSWRARTQGLANKCFGHRVCRPYIWACKGRLSSGSGRCSGNFKWSRSKNSDASLCWEGAYCKCGTETGIRASDNRSIMYRMGISSLDTA
jgi:hypothetical protein